jgi:hypothetical protein
MKGLEKWKKKKSDSNENNMQQRSAQRGETRHLSIPKTTKYLVNCQKLLIEKKNAHKLLPTKLQNIRSDSNKNPLALQDPPSSHSHLMLKS